MVRHVSAVAAVVFLAGAFPAFGALAPWPADGAGDRQLWEAVTGDFVVRVGWHGATSRAVRFPDVMVDVGQEPRTGHLFDALRHVHPSRGDCGDLANSHCDELDGSRQARTRESWGYANTESEHPHIVALDYEHHSFSSLGEADLGVRFDEDSHRKYALVVGHAPEPATLILLLAGAIVLFRRRR